MTREEMWKEFENQLIRETRISMTMDFDTIERTTILGIKETFAKWKDRLEQEPCEDAVSRQAVLEYIKGSDAELGHSSENEIVCQDIKELPPVTPTRKKGKWKHDYSDTLLECSKCRRYIDIDYLSDTPKYCPYCGAEMEGEDDR